MAVTSGGPSGSFSVSVSLPLSFLSHHIPTEVGIEMSNLAIQAKMSWSHSILSYINLSWPVAWRRPPETVARYVLSLSRQKSSDNQVVCKFLKNNRKNY